MATIVSLNWPASLPPLDTFHQNQRDLGPLTGEVECVTTTISTARNMMNELLALRTGAKEKLSTENVQDYVKELDALHWRGWLYRIPTDCFDIRIPFLMKESFNPRGFMLPRSQALFALRRIASEFRKHYGLSFKIRQISGNTLEEIAGHLQAGNLVLISGMFEPAGKEQGVLGGGPHTYGPVTSVDFIAGRITVIDTGEQPLTTTPFEDFLDFWGRKSFLNLYTRPFTMTVLIPDSLNHSQ
jgi:hypothetical protein